MTESLDWRRITHLVLINLFVGGMVGIERTVLPLLAEVEFGIASKTAVLAFIATFGITKAAVNFFAGTLSERVGRKRLLVAGWLTGIPVPLILIWAPSWSWVLFANILLGVNQALTWSMTVVMKVDLATPKTFGLVIGWNEFAGYTGMAATAALTGVLATSFGLRSAPFVLGIAIALIGLSLALAAEDTKPPANQVAGARTISMGEALARGTWTDRRLASASLAGLVTNLKDGALWGLLPLLLAARGLSVAQVGLIVGTYPLIWAGSQLVFGPLSDRVGRRILIWSGLVTQGLGVSLFTVSDSLPAYMIAALIVGTGTGMVYPVLLAFVSDNSATHWRASALGVYRLWRDSGYAVGALGAGFIADQIGVDGALSVTAVCVLAACALFSLGSQNTHS
jgi:MFS family permease